MKFGSLSTLQVCEMIITRSKLCRKFVDGNTFHNVINFIFQATDRFEDLSYDGKAPPQEPQPGPIQPQPRDGKRCEFYINGKGDSKQVIVTINKRIKDTDALKTELEQKCKSACKYIICIRTGKIIHKLEDFLHGEQYVISGPGQKTLKDAKYGSRHGWSNRPISTKVGKIRNSELGLLAKDLPSPASNTRKKREHKPARLMTITSNTNRGIKATVVLNPCTTQLFEDVLAQMGSMVAVCNPVALYTTEMPFIRVRLLKM